MVAGRQFEQRSYVNRTAEENRLQGPSIDEKVLNHARQWLRSQARLGWISLSTSAGRGNTWLLRSLLHRFSHDSTFQLTLRPFLVRSSDREGAPPSLLTPLQELLTEPHGGWRIGRGIRKGLMRVAERPLLYPLAVVLCLFLAMVCGSIAAYVDNAGRGSTVRGYVQHVREGAARDALVFALGVLGVGAAMGAIRLFVDRKKRNEMTDAEKAELVSPARLIEGLRDCARNRNGIVLLIDRAHLLREEDRVFLIDIGRGGKRTPEIAELLARHRILVITVDEISSLWQGYVEKITTVAVPRFNVQELREIARAQSREAYERVKDETEEAREILEQARDNIHVLFGGEEHLEVDMGMHFQRAQEENFDALSFGGDAMMAYQAVRVVGYPSDVQTTTAELSKWVSSLATCPHLAAFGIKGPASLQTVMQTFRKSTLAHVSGSRVMLDAERCRALVDWLRKREPDIAARAYFYWCEEAARTLGSDAAAVAESGELAAVWRHHVKAAAWMLMEISEFAAPSAILDAAVDGDRLRLRRLAAETLVLASIVNAREGDTTLAIASAADAVEWFDDALVAAYPDLADRFATHTWELYWNTADHLLHETLDDLQIAVPSIAQRPSWRIETQFQALARGESPGAPEADALPESNRTALTDAWRAARQTRGFAFAPGERPMPAIGDGVPAPAPASARTALRFLRASADVSEELEWIASQPAEVAACCVGDELLQLYDRAASLHARTRLLRGEERLPAAYEAEDCYGRALLLASIIGWRGLTAELSFMVGLLLSELTEPVPHSGAGPAPWERWETAFHSAIAIEREAGWFLYTPEIHMTRWQFFRRVAVDMSLEDGFNAYQAAKRAGVAIEVLVEMHRQLCQEFNNCGDSDEDRNRSADLFVDWAEILAAKPAARDHWELPTLELEQASAYMYAAQERRLIASFSEAEKLLEKADACIAAADDDANRRNVHQTIAFQRLQLYIQQDKWADAEIVRRTLWVGAQVGDNIYPLLIESHISSDHRKHLLDAPWPLAEDGGAAEDPDAPQLSVDRDWLRVCQVDGIQTRFEYRFWQLHQLIRDPRMLTANFSQAACHVAGIGIAETALAVNIRPYLVSLLDFVRRFYEWSRHEAQLIETLRLLVTATDHAPDYQAAYVHALAAYEKLFEREQALLTQSPMHWYLLAERIHHYFYILVDERLFGSEVRQTLTHGGVDVETALNAASGRRETYRKAEECVDRRNYGAAITLLDTALPSTDALWVFWEDLRGLQLWLRSVEASGSPVERESRAQQLRAFTIRYVRQLSSTVDDVQVQMIALKLIGVLESVLTGNARLPIARKISGGRPRLPAELGGIAASL